VTDICHQCVEPWTGVLFFITCVSSHFCVCVSLLVRPGIVPSNFVRRLGCDQPKRDSRFQAKAVYGYHGQPDEVSFTKGEILDVLDDSEDWWEVRKACGEEGQAPSNYLGKLVPPGSIRAKALYAYQADASDPEEVSFSKLDTFDVLDNSRKWWTVRKDSDGRAGIAPSNYLRVIT